MKSLWNDSEAKNFKTNLALRAYTSRLLGTSEDLVLHGGGNTSLKEEVKNIFGEQEWILYVKGSGYDLKVIPEKGFSPCRLEVLKKLAKLNALSDTDMVRELRASMTDPSAPTPSVETILHAIIPYKFVDHTHADAVVTLTNTKKGREIIEKLYGSKMLVLPYTMPGFVLARQIYEATHDLDWKSIDGIILLNHGVFTFSDDAKESYEKMIEIVDKAEKYLERETKKNEQIATTDKKMLALEVAKMRKKVSDMMGRSVLAKAKEDAKSVEFSKRSNIKELCSKGPITPDHIIHTKRIPMVVDKNWEEDLNKYESDYKKYFEKNRFGDLVCLDPAPRFVVWPGNGLLVFGINAKRLEVMFDITEHTTKCIQQSEEIGGYEVLSEKDYFELEYWELEQAKLKRGVSSGSFEGRVALVSGAASGIGKAIALKYLSEGASVVALDINPEVKKIAESLSFMGLVCDVTNTEELEQAIALTVKSFGGLDIVVSNAGIFPKGQHIEKLEDKEWEKGVNLNLTSHMKLMRASIPFLKVGINPSIVIVASKNVPAPGPGASAYSAAKAGLTQLARVAALELGESGIRVNVLHPNAVFDTGIWTEEVLENRARHYQMTVHEYKTNNVLKTLVSSADVANAAMALSGDLFLRTTGAQIPVDGGNDRVI